METGRHNVTAWHGYSISLLKYHIMDIPDTGQRTDHDDEKDEIRDIKLPLLELERHAKITNENLRLFLMNLNQPDMIARINQLDLSDRSLDFLCEGIALEKEDYEICMAVEAIKKQRIADRLKLTE